MEENRRILVVDDDPDIRKAFTSMFQGRQDKALMEEGWALFQDLAPVKQPFASSVYELAMAESGEEGVREVETALEKGRPYAVVFLDMKMSGIDGAETARRVFHADSRVKIVIMTAYSEFRPEEISAIAGRQDLFYLRKPFTREEILQFARSLVRQWSLERERDCLQEKLEQANARLEETVAARTSELVEANRRLSILDRDKMTFLRYLSHEMNTPLNWIAAANIIDRETLSASDQEMLTIVEKGFERLSALVHEVLEYFQMAGADLKLQRETIVLLPFLEDILEGRRRKMAESGIRVDLHIPRDAALEADPEYFRELVEAILDNALDYSKPGGTVTISDRQTNDIFCLTIQDHGKGIPRENLEKIFEAFATEPFHRREEGCGLSLPKARHIAEAHGWEIRAESQGPDRGASIVVEGRVNAEV